MNILTFPVSKEASDVDFNKIIPNSDSMETPPGLLNAVFEHFGGFNLDVAASQSNAKCAFYFRDNDLVDGLYGEWDVDINIRILCERKWHPGRVWCNPPYSNPYPWVAKAYDEVKNKSNAEIAVLLLRFDPSTALWRDYAHKADEIHLLTGRRIRFIGRWHKPDGTLSKNTTSNYPHMLMVFRG